MSSFVLIAVFIAWLLAGFRYSARANRHLLDPQRLETSSTLVRPELYSPEGQSARALALKVWWIGAAVFFGVALVLSRLA